MIEYTLKLPYVPFSFLLGVSDNPWDFGILDVSRCFTSVHLCKPLPLLEYFVTYHDN